MKIIIVEDELASQAYLKNILLLHYPGIDIVAATDNVPDAVLLIKKHRPDIAFMDVEIKMGTSFDVLEQTKGYSFEVIFTTAFNTFAVDAFRHHAIDYLLKPLNESHVVEAMGRCMQRINSNNRNDQVGKLLEQLQQPAVQKAKLGIPTLEGIEFVAIPDIIYGEAKGNYTDIWLKNGIKITTSRKLKEMEESLPKDLFFRIHHSYIVNLQYVKKYYKGRGGYLILQDDHALPVSSARKDDFLKWLG